MREAKLAVISASLTFLLSSMAIQSLAPNKTPRTSLVKETRKENSDNSFVTTKDGHFELDGTEFRFIGSNNYYLHYKDKSMIKSVIESAASGGFNVLRMWGFFDGVDDDYQNNHAFM